MAQDHHHHGGSAADYFTEQLLTIFVVGLFGFTGIWMYYAGKLQFILAPQFQLPVLIGGIGILANVAVRAVSVWREAGRVSSHVHTPHGEPDHSTGHGHHEHGPDCDHDHDHHGHDHDHHHAAHGEKGHHDHDHHGHDHGEDDHGHSHDLSWVFVRMLVLAFAVAVGLFVMPQGGLSQTRINALLGSDQVVSLGDVGQISTGDGVVMSFNDLREAAYDESKREALSGKVGIIEGKFRAIAQNQFTLYKLKMTCCAADAVPLKIRIVTPTALGAIGDGDWVRVKGEVRFLAQPNSSQYLPVIAAADIADVRNLTATGQAKNRNEYE